VLLESIFIEISFYKRDCGDFEYKGPVAFLLKKRCNPIKPVPFYSALEHWTRKHRRRFEVLIIPIPEIVNAGFRAAIRTTK
jgi:hypothetical protein